MRNIIKTLIWIPFFYPFIATSLTAFGIYIPPLRADVDFSDKHEWGGVVISLGMSEAILILMILIMEEGTRLKRMAGDHFGYVAEQIENRIFLKSRSTISDVPLVLKKGYIAYCVAHHGGRGPTTYSYHLFDLSCYRKLIFQSPSLVPRYSVKYARANLAFGSGVFLIAMFSVYAIAFLFVAVSAGDETRLLKEASAFVISKMLRNETYVYAFYDVAPRQMDGYTRYIIGPTILVASSFVLSLFGLGLLLLWYKSAAIKKKFDGRQRIRSVAAAYAHIISEAIARLSSFQEEEQLTDEIILARHVYLADHDAIVGCRQVFESRLHSFIQNPETRKSSSSIRPPAIAPAGRSGLRGRSRRGSANRLTSEGHKGPS